MHRPGRAERTRGAVERIDALLQTARGKPDDAFDKRRPERPPEPRYVSVDGYRELFDRLVIQDFEYLTSLSFAATPSVLYLLLPQSVLGRAQNGHGWFQDERGRPLMFVDATFDRVLTALEKTDPSLRGDYVRRRRDDLVQRTIRHVLRGIDKPSLPLEDAEGPLMGVEFLRGVEVASSAFLTGMVAAGFMDDWDQRQMAMSYFGTAFGGGPLVLGGGEIHVIDRVKFKETGIVDPGRVEFSELDLRRLRALGVIVGGGDGQAEHGSESGGGGRGEGDKPRCFPKHDQAYFRRRLADGVSDDLAMIYAGARWGFDAMLGAFLMDAIDTYDKAVWCFVDGGWDGRLAQMIQDGWARKHGQPLVSGQEILSLIRFAAKANDPPTSLSSSHRRFLQREEGTRHPTLLHHKRFLDGQPLDEIELGFSRVKAKDFYTIAYLRLREVGLEAPPPMFRKRAGREKGWRRK